MILVFTYKSKHNIPRRPQEDVVSGFVHTRRALAGSKVVQFVLFRQKFSPETNEMSKDIHLRLGACVPHGDYVMFPLRRPFAKLVALHRALSLISRAIFA